MFKPFYHLLSFILPASACAFLASTPHSSLGALVWTLPFWAILLLDWFGPKNSLQSDQQAPKTYYDGILLILAVLQSINIILMLVYVSALPWQTSADWLTSGVNLVVLRFVVATSSGTSAIVVAHELIHRPQKYWQYLGRLLLLSVCYEHFVITHKQGHHLSITMADDVAAARFGEPFKDYWRRVYVGHWRFAWRSEQQRLGLANGDVMQWATLKNQVLHGVFLELLILVLVLVFFGGLAAVMFIYQAVAAVRILEAVNYFQHWGLSDSRFAKSYGWVNRSWLSSYLFIGLANHIGHHQDEHTPFYQIAYSEQGPKLPYGYFVMNLWVKLGNASYQKMAERELLRFQAGNGELE
jgi:alkane 1-monooxygenase